MWCKFGHTPRRFEEEQNPRSPLDGDVYVQNQGVDFLLITEFIKEVSPISSKCTLPCPLENATTRI